MSAPGPRSRPELEDEHQSSDKRENDSERFFHELARKELPETASERTSNKDARNAPCDDFPDRLSVHGVNGGANGGHDGERKHARGDGDPGRDAAAGHELMGASAIKCW